MSLTSSLTRSHENRLTSWLPKLQGPGSQSHLMNDLTAASYSFRQLDDESVLGYAVRFGSDYPIMICYDRLRD